MGKVIEIKAVDLLSDLKPYIDMKLFQENKIDDIISIIRVPGGLIVNQTVETKTGNVPGITRMFQLDKNSVFIPFPQFAIDGGI